MQSISLTSLLLVLLLATGCSTMGTKIQSDKLATIKKGVTTEQEIISTFGNPDSITTTPDRRVLVYSHRTDNSTQRNVAAATGSVIGGLVGGSIGSLAGGLAGGNVMNSEVNQEILSVEIDAKTNKVLNYQFQQSQ